MKKFNQTEQIAFNAQHPKKPVSKWQVICGKVILFEAKTKGLCVWWCRRYCIKTENIKAV